MVASYDVDQGQIPLRSNTRGNFDRTESIPIRFLFYRVTLTLAHMWVLRFHLKSQLPHPHSDQPIPLLIYQSTPLPRHNFLFSLISVTDSLDHPCHSSTWGTLRVLLLIIILIRNRILLISYDKFQILLRRPTWMTNILSIINLLLALTPCVCQVQP